MKKYRLGILVLAVILLSVKSAVAQSNSTSSGIKQAVINFRDIAKYYKDHPLPATHKMPIDEDDFEEHRAGHSGPSSQVHMYKPRPASAMGPLYGPMLPVSPVPNDTFLSTSSPETSIPPDTHGAVDSQYCVTAINPEVRIQDRTGVTVSVAVLDGFWSSVLPAGTGSFDPRVHYDPFNKRWILVSDAVNQAGFTSSTILVAVSVTNDPTGAWNTYAIPVDPTGAAWLDFPNVGFNKYWVAIAGNMFPNTGGGAAGARLYILNYASLMAGTAITPVVVPEPASFSICPAQTFDTTETSLYAVESWQGSSGQLRLWKISGPVGSPALTSVGYPATTMHWHGSGPGGGGDFATQLGTTNKVDAGDDRFTSLVYKNGKLWCTHTVFLPDPGTASRSSVMWWQIDTLANPVQIGLINDPVTPSFFVYSSISVNDSNDALIGMGYLNATMHPSCAYALHMHTDLADSTRPPHIFRHGTAAYYTTFGGAKNRWGDFSQTCLDPRNNMDFWTLQEASNSAGTTANWDTWWANYQFCPKPHAPTITYSGAPCAGDTANYIIDSIPGATSYVWYVAGGGWTGASTTTTINATAGTGTGTIVVLAYNSCGEGEATTLSVAPVPLPPTPSIGVYSPPCTGDATAEFTASGTAGFIWSVVGTGWSGSSTLSSLTTTVGTGAALIICTATNACGSSAPDTLSIYPGTPVDTFTVSTHNTLIDTNITLTFAGSAPPGSSYTWYFGTGIATPGTGPGPQTIHWTTGGAMNVTLVVDNNGCSSTYSDVIYVKDPTAVNVVTGIGNNISLNPNPSDGVFDIVFASPVSKPVTIKITDIDGRIVYNREYSSTPTNKIQVKAANLNPGNYTVSIITSDGVVTKKLAISK